jgi:hypothetical protein
MNHSVFPMRSGNTSSIKRQATDDDVLIRVKLMCIIQTGATVPHVLTPFFSGTQGSAL